VGARPANRPDAPASRGISHTRVLPLRSPGAAASRSWFVLQGLTTAGSTVIGFDAPVTTLASRPGPHRLPRDRFPDRLTGRVCSPLELPPLLPRHGTLRPARLRADPLEGATSHRAPLSRFRRPFSAREWRRPPRPARRPTERGFACRYVPSSPFLRPRRLAPPSTPVRVSPHGTRGIRPSHGIPASRGPQRSRCDLPLLVLPTGPASAVAFACTARRTFRGLLVWFGPKPAPESTVSADARFP
jgi:hypothetical protein